MLEAAGDELVVIGVRQLVQELAPGETSLQVGDASRRYVVTALDAAGNESEPSDPVGGRP